MEIITLNDAKSLAQKYIAKLDLGEELVILDDETLTESFGWVFFYNTKKFQETGDFRYMVGGNAPIIIDKKSGRLSETGTAYEISHYINEYKSRENN
ncbi:YrhB domain-containing protein [Shewanella nanhaiensis]|uniref:YrhB family protein n=1 Tax=Shewanella nanhaiensis TaxID=2864872 RepID=A0ABS7E6V8_9GAMM|nr:YrhB domain-containing protein [Shewanella nanhaiensis]MBW8185385.1 YrhB family protein [Shewanella nanhaiensis]